MLICYRIPLECKAKSSNFYALINFDRVSAAGDKQIRVFDVGEEVARIETYGRIEEKTLSYPPTHVLKCHQDRVKA